MSEIRASGNVVGKVVTIKAELGNARAKIRFIADGVVDELGAGDVDYLLAGLPEATEAVMERLIEARRREEEA